MDVLTTALIAFAVTEVTKTLLLEALDVTLLGWVKQALVSLVCGILAYTLALGAWVALAAIGAAFLLHALYRAVRAYGDAARLEVMRAVRRRV